MDRAEQNYLEQLQKERPGPGLAIAGRHKVGRVPRRISVSSSRGPALLFADNLHDHFAASGARVELEEHICCQVPSIIAPSTNGTVSDGPSMRTRGRDSIRCRRPTEMVTIFAFARREAVRTHRSDRRLRLPRTRSWSCPPSIQRRTPSTMPERIPERDTASATCRVTSRTSPCPFVEIWKFCVATIAAEYRGRMVCT